MSSGESCILTALSALLRNWIILGQGWEPSGSEIRAGNVRSPWQLQKGWSGREGRESAEGEVIARRGERNAVCRRLHSRERDHTNTREASGCCPRAYCTLSLLLLPYCLPPSVILTLRTLGILLRSRLQSTLRYHMGSLLNALQTVSSRSCRSTTGCPAPTPPYPISLGSCLSSRLTTHPIPSFFLQRLNVYPMPGYQQSCQEDLKGKKEH